VINIQDADFFQTLFAVPMTCESCVKDISGSLYKLGGIQKVEANLKDQLVSIEGTGSSHLSTSGTSGIDHGTDL
jgi:copper chaperone CopZ